MDMVNGITLLTTIFGKRSEVYAAKGLDSSLESEPD